MTRDGDRRFVGERCEAGAQDLEACLERNPGLLPAVAQIMDPLVITRWKDGVVLYANQQFAALADAPIDDLVGRSAEPLYRNLEDRDAFRRALSKDGVVRRHVLRAERPDGEQLVLEASARRAPFEGDDCVVATLRDVTRMHRREREYRALTDKSGAGVWRVTADAKTTTYANPALAEIFGADSPAQLEGMPLEEMLTAQSYERVLEHGRLREEDGSSTYEVRIVRLDGGTRDVLIQGVPELDEEGSLVARVATAIDITEKKRLEEQVQQKQRLEVVGEFAGGIAHDFNNFLTVIRGEADEIGQHLPDEHAARESLRNLENAAESAGAVTSQILTFSKRGAQRREVVDMHAFLRGQYPLFRHLLPTGVDMHTELEAERPYVEADAGQLEQVVMNLVSNAGHAMPDGGRATLSTRNVYLDAEYERTHFSVSEGDYVLLAVSDTGVGMDEETQRRIFEPFFTTKEQGTGLGLSTTYSIVNDHGGAVWAYSEEGVGTTFKVYLPEAEKRLGIAGVRASEEGGYQGRRVLVVEDTEAVRRVMRQVMERSGVIVHEASSAEQALDRWSQYGGLDLVLTDVTLPGRSGPEFVREVRARGYDGPAVFTSGYRSQEMVSDGTLEEGVRFLEKPFSPDQLLEVVGGALSS